MTKEDFLSQFKSDKKLYLKWQLWQYYKITIGKMTLLDPKGYKKFKKDMGPGNVLYCEENKWNVDKMKPAMEMIDR